MNIAFNICICYNAIRQREVGSPNDSTTNENPRAATLGFSIPKNGGNKSVGSLPTIVYKKRNIQTETDGG